MEGRKETTSKKENQAGLSSNELHKLFLCYDRSRLGFIRIGLLRERIKAMQLPVNAMIQALDLMKDIEDDEMVNLIEFQSECADTKQISIESDLPNHGSSDTYVKLGFQTSNIQTLGT